MLRTTLFRFDEYLNKAKIVWQNNSFVPGSFHMSFANCFFIKNKNHQLKPENLYSIIHIIGYVIICGHQLLIFVTIS